MRYAYKDLGRQREGCTAIVHWAGRPATVMLFDPVNFTKYVDRMPCHCDTGGRYRCPPARLRIPHDGRWYAVVDLGGYSSARPPTVEIEGQARQPVEDQQTEEARVNASGIDAPSSHHESSSRSGRRRRGTQSRRRAGPARRRAARAP